MAIEKCGTNARVFSRILEHGDCTSEIRQRNRGKKQSEKRKWKEV